MSDRPTARPPDDLDDERRSSALHDRFAAVVAHELRNPLSAVKIALQTVGRGEALPNKDATRLDIALREVGTIERVLDLILEWARPSDLFIETATVGDVLRQVSLFSTDALNERGVILEVVVDNTDAPLDADVVRLGSAIAELVRNAAFASPRGAVVRLECRPSSTDTVFIVSDKGCGLPSGQEKRVFEPFESQQVRGVGLGLTVARDVCQRHGGTLVVDPAPVQGSVVRVVIPTSKQGLA